MTEREALKLLVDVFGGGDWHEEIMDSAWAENANNAIAEAKKVLAGAEGERQPEQEPVAFYVYKPTLPRGHLGNVSDGDLPWVYDQDPSSGYSARMLVYTTPPQRKPLTDAQIHKASTQAGMQEHYMGFHSGFIRFARAIEAAHGIKE